MVVEAAGGGGGRWVSEEREGLNSRLGIIAVLARNGLCGSCLEDQTASAGVYFEEVLSLSVLTRL